MSGWRSTVRAFSTNCPVGRAVTDSQTVSPVASGRLLQSSQYAVRDRNGVLHATGGAALFSFEAFAPFPTICVCSPFPVASRLPLVYH